MSGVDANKLTVAKLKSALSENGFSDRIVAREKKAYYVKLYNELVVPLLEDRERDVKQEKKRETRRGSDEENLPNQSKKEAEEERKRKARRQTLAVVPRSPMVPIETPEKRLVKRKNSSRQTLMSQTPAGKSSGKRNRIDDMLQQLPDKEREAPEDSRDADEVDELLRRDSCDEGAVSQPIELETSQAVLDLPAEAATLPVLPGFTGLTPITSPHHSLAYLRQRKKLRLADEEEREEEAKVQQEREAREREEREAREREAREQAEREARAREAREQEAREQAEREAREREARERAEQEAREREAREHEARKLEAREREAREREAREREARNREQKEREAREREAREREAQRQSEAKRAPAENLPAPIRAEVSAGEEAVAAPSEEKLSDTARVLRRRSVAKPAKRAERTTLLSSVMITVEILLAAVLVVYFFPSLLDTSSGFLNVSLSGGPGGRQATRFCDTITNAQDAQAGDCLRCPTHANCFDGKATCFTTYVYRDGDCVEDESFKFSALALKDRVHSLLNEKAGHYQCGYEGAVSPRLTETQLRQELIPTNPEESKRFSTVFDLMREEVATHPEWGIVISSNEQGIRTWELKETTSLPLECAVKMQLWAYLWQVIAASTVAVAIPLLWWRRRRQAQENAEVDELVEEVKGLLVAQRQRAEEDEALRTNAWVPLTHIRDTLFHDDPERKRRFMPRGQTGSGQASKEWLRLWQKVVQAVSTDRRILTSPQMFEGEQVTTWEWVSLVPSTARASGFMSPIKQRRQQIAEARRDQPAAPAAMQQPVFAALSAGDEAVNIGGEDTCATPKPIYPRLN